MSTNYNRIKVADLETNQPNKILTTDNSGELEFTDINAIKVDNYNALDYTDAGKALDARQGKILKDLINNINAILISDNLNLNTIQKLVDAIEDVKASLDTILVNNLTSGGTTKALTAEMGKTLQNTKVDKAPGERLINAEEITKLSGISNVVTTVKTIASTALATQNITGFVNYINALNPVLVVGPNEIVKYTTSDTGRTFELNLRSRSFGVGQPAITASNVIEITDFLNKDIKLSNYLSTRNDGQSPTNRVLGTDANGNLKMYSISSFPAPFLESLIADSPLPSNTGKVILKGAFFTPTMTVTITGQTVNYITFINDNEVHVNVTTGPTEGYFDVILNNGLTSTFIGKMLVVLGTIYKPVLADWDTIIQTPNLNLEGSMLLQNIATISSARWTKAIDPTKKFRIHFSVTESPYVLKSSVPQTFKTVFKLINIASGDNYEIRAWLEPTTTRVKFYWYKNGTQIGVNRYIAFANFRIEYDGVNLYINQDINNESIMSVIDTITLTDTWRILWYVERYDITKIKYIELVS
ncbi:hypothetical protein ACQ9BO_13415 [Flavobacterium sp. P21]|uniref:hypothetical protein n=1 Tax=Flavobacterium sp. P21 TaxID=3423948 RepID=UPI003D667820